MESGAESGAGAGSGTDKQTGQFRKGYDPRRGRGPKPRSEEVPVEGVPLAERMGRFLTEQLSDSDLRRMLRDSPGDYRRLMELAKKVAVVESPVESSVPSSGREDDPGEEAMRVAGGEFLRWLRERNADEGVEPR